MESLQQIPGIDEAFLELLEVAGFRDCQSLARAGIEPLVRELERANGILQIAGIAPTHEQIGAWIRTAREIVGEQNTEPATEVVMPANFEIMPEVAAMLENAPCAIPFPGRWLARSNITVGEIIPGILLNRYAGDLEIRVEEHLASSRKVPKAHAGQYVRSAEKPQMGRLDIDVSRLRAIGRHAESGNGSQPAHPIELPCKRAEAGSINLSTQALPETNAGKERNSRRYIRGVLHSNPWSVRVAATITLGLIALLPVAFAVSILLVLSHGDPENYSWVRPWWLVFPMLVPVAALFWLIFGFPCSCRICRQKLFFPGKHRKNARTHHIPLLGYIVPLIFHLLIFQWFRCMHCGTPVRLRK